MYLFSKEVFYMINGEAFSEKYPQNLILNRGLLFGESIFTSTLLLDGKILFLADHIERLEKSFNFLFFEHDWNVILEYLREDLKKITALKLLGEHYLRITIFEDYAGKICRSISYRKKEADFSVSMKRSEVLRGQSDFPTFLKAGNYLLQNREKKIIKESGYNDVYYTTKDLKILESSVSNIFIVCNSGKKIKTPPIQSGVLAGVQRKHLISLLKKQKIAFEECNISVSELQQASEVFLTNSVRGLILVKQIDSEIKTNRSRYLQLKKLFTEYIKDHWVKI